MDETGEPRNHVIFYDENDVQYLAEVGKGLKEFSKEGEKSGAIVERIYELPDSMVRVHFISGSTTRFSNPHTTSFKSGDIG